MVMFRWMNKRFTFRWFQRKHPILAPLRLVWCLWGRSLSSFLLLSLWSEIEVFMVQRTVGWLGEAGFYFQGCFSPETPASTHKYTLHANLEWWHQGRTEKLDRSIRQGQEAPVSASSTQICNNGANTVEKQISPVESNKGEIPLHSSPPHFISHLKQSPYNVAVSTLTDGFPAAPGGFAVMRCIMPTGPGSFWWSQWATAPRRAAVSLQHL